MAKIKENDNTKCWQGCTATELSHSVGGSVNGSTICKEGLAAAPKHATTYDSAIPLSVFHPGERAPASTDGPAQERSVTAPS